MTNARVDDDREGAVCARIRRGSAADLASAGAGGHGGARENDELVGDHRHHRVLLSVTVLMSSRKPAAPVAFRIADLTNRSTELTQASEIRRQASFHQLEVSVELWGCS